MLLFFIIFSCNKTENTISIIEKIPDNPLVVLNINNFKEINYNQLNLLEKSLNLKFENIDLLEPQGELIYSFNKTGKNNLNSVVIQQDFDYKIKDSLVRDTISYNGQNIYLFKDDFYLATAADIVADPSAPEAFVQGIMEGKEWIWESGALVEMAVDEIKKEITTATSINLENKKIKAFSQFLSKL